MVHITPQITGSQKQKTLMGSEPVYSDPVRSQPFDLIEQQIVCEQVKGAEAITFIAFALNKSLFCMKR
jgi:hypothetical protein